MSERGHRTLPHTADVIVEAWGPDLAVCVEEALTALIGIFAAGPPASVTAHHTVDVGPGPDESLLLDALDEVIFTLDTSPQVPIGATVTGGDGRLAVVLRLADPDDVETTGAGPKAISRSGLELVSRPDRTRCRFLVDV